MNSKHLIAITTLAFASAGVAIAQPISREDWAGPTPIAAEQRQQPLSRVEVQADWNLYQRAGLSEYQTGERSINADPLFDERLAQYQNARSGPEYVAEIRRLGGDVSAVAYNMYEHGVIPANH